MFRPTRAYRNRSKSAGTHVVFVCPRRDDPSHMRARLDGRIPRDGRLRPTGIDRVRGKAFFRCSLCGYCYVLNRP